jgi:hypothetical protein
MQTKGKKRYASLAQRRRIQKKIQSKTNKL